MKKMICFDCKMSMDPEDFERHELATCEEHKQKMSKTPFMSMAQERRFKSIKRRNA